MAIVIMSKVKITRMNAIKTEVSLKLNVLHVVVVVAFFFNVVVLNFSRPLLKRSAGQFLTIAKEMASIISML